MDEFTRPKVVEGAFDEIFVGKTPILMGVEPASFCWVLGKIADDRSGPTWAGEFASFPSLAHVVSDAGSGLLKGLALNQAERSQPLQHSLDVFHTLREGSRAWRMTEARLWQLEEQAEKLENLLRRRERRGLSMSGHANVSYKARQLADQALEATIGIEAAWGHVKACLELFTPEGELNTASAARAKLDQWLPALKGPQWSKTVRLLQRAESLTFLERLEQQLGELALDEELKQDALRFEWLRRRPQLLKGDDSLAGARRGWWLLATVRQHRDENFRQAVASVRGVIRGCVRASSLVEGINSVVRMQQARHRKLTPGLLDLKRLYWNCRVFRTGRRRKQSPYELLGVKLPTGTWWELLKLSPDQLRQELSTQQLAS